MDRQDWEDENARNDAYARLDNARKAGPFGNELAAQLPRDATGKLAAYAWPGGYPIIYFAADGGVFCPGCANGENGSRATAADLDPSCPDDDQWRIVAADVHWEGEPETCAHCGGSIASAYGPVTDDSEPDEEEI